MQPFISGSMSLSAVVLLGNKFGHAASTADTPVQKVIQLMTDLLEKNKSEMHDEKVRFTKMTQWCESTGAAKKTSVEDADQKIEQLSADILKADSDVEQLGEDITELDGKIDQETSELQAAKAQRQAELKDYQATHADYSESIDAIERAIKVLSENSDDVEQALLQLRGVAKAPASTVSVDTKRALLLATEMKLADDPSKANAYENQSGSVVEMLEELRHKFQDERLALEKDEMNRKQTFQMTAQQLTVSIEDGKSQRSEKTELRARRKAESAEATGDLKETRNGRKADSQYLAEMIESCKTKTDEFHARQALRQEELEAIQKAIDIISSDTVSGTADKHLPAALVQKEGMSLAQLRSTVNGDGDIRDKVAALLSRSAEKIGSQMLRTLAGRVSEDPFVKIRTMIKDLIAKLIQEAEDEASHKGWCDGELGQNKKTRDQKSIEVDELTAKIEELTALELKLTEDIATLRKEVEEISKAMKEATKQRNEESEKNAVTLKESKAAHAAVQRALTVLREFYKKAATATAMAQIRQTPDEDMPHVGDSYQGAQGASTGIIGMLEVVESDFYRLITDTEFDEHKASQEYDELSESSAQDTKEKEKEARHKGFTLTRTKRALGQAKEDLTATQEELDAALEYYEKLKPTCIGEEISYEDRVAMRKAEIQSLKEALEMLGGQALGDW